MEELVNRLSEEQKRELVNALAKADDILESVCDEDSEYHETDFYHGLYDLMYRLGIWC